MGELSAELQAQLLDGSWDVFQGAAFPKFGDLHLIDRFPLGDGYSRLEAMDYGLNGTAWALVATDFDGNHVFVDSVTEKNPLPDEVAARVIEKRKAGWGFKSTVYADLSIWHAPGRAMRNDSPAADDGGGGHRAASSTCYVTSSSG